MNTSSLETAIRQYESERTQKISAIKERVTREKILPYNADIDTSRSKAISAINDELNARIAEINDDANNRIASLRKEYEAKRQELVALGEQKKKENSEAVLAAETASVMVEYDTIITELSSILQKIKPVQS